MEKSIFCHPYFKKLYVYTVQHVIIQFNMWWWKSCQITKSSLTIEYFIINEFYFDYIRFMDITRDKLGLDGTDVIDVINLKCDPILSGSLRKMKGYFPAYHMHRENWITILLDGTVPPPNTRTKCTPAPSMVLNPCTCSITERSCLFMVCTFLFSKLL